MSEKPKITMSTKMDTLMTWYPEVIPILIDNRMHCFGCLLAAFHDVAHAACEHELDEEFLLDAFVAATAINRS